MKKLFFNKKNNFLGLSLTKYGGPMQIQHTINAEALTNLKQYIRTNTENLQMSGDTDQNDKPAYVTHISTSAKVMNRLDEFLNMGQSDSLSLDDMSEAEQDTFLGMLSALLKEGVMGYEMLEIEDGMPEKYFIVNQIGSQETYGKQLALESEPIS
jgi:hypothetical protein